MKLPEGTGFGVEDEMKPLGIILSRCGTGHSTEKQQCRYEQEILLFTNRRGYDRRKRYYVVCSFRAPVRWELKLVKDEQIFLLFDIFRVVRINAGKSRQ